MTRSLVLARELADLGHSVRLAGTGATEVSKTINSLSDLATTNLNEPFQTQERLNLILATHPDLVVVDGYHFDSILFDFMDNAGIRYGLIDDGSQTHASNPAFILNQNANASADMYRVRFPNASLLLGLEYALLRKEFVDALGQKEQGPHRPYVMVSLGGSDVAGLSTSIVRLLWEHGLPVRVAIGAAVPNRERVLSEAISYPGVQPVNQSEFEITMANCKFCVIAAGSSLWEALYLGVPTLALIVAENQVEPALKALDSSSKLRVVNTLEKPPDPSELVSAFDNLLRIAEESNTIHPQGESPARRAARLIAAARG